MKIIIYDLLHYQFFKSCIYIEYILYHYIQRTLVNLSRNYILEKDLAIIKWKINVQ